MAQLMMVLLLAAIGLATSEVLIYIPAQLGSDLHLPVTDACRFDGGYQFDVSNSTKNIGTYDGDELHPRNGHKGRLTYDDETCIITLKKLTAQDGTRFTVTLKKDMKTDHTSHDIQYRVNITDPLTSPPNKENKTQPQAEHLIHNTSQISTEDILGFVAFCLSLDFPVNVLFPICLWIIHKNCNKLGKDIREMSGHISSWMTFVCGVVAICILSIGNPCCLFLSLVPFLLLVELLRFCGRLPKCVLDAPLFIFSFIDDDKKPTCKKIARWGWRVLILLTQILFPVVVGILYSKFGIFKPESVIGYIVLSIAISIALRIMVTTIVYCRKTKPTFSSVLTDDPNTKPDDPVGTREVSI